MSSTPSPASVSNSQNAAPYEEQSETPNTTPLAVSNAATPIPEVEMTDANTNVDPTDNIDLEGENDQAIDADGDDETQEELLTLPVSKIKKIFRLDPDYGGASKNAVYATGLATELFIQYFAEQASLLAKMDRRKKIQYKDFSNAVQSQDSLHFLSDIVPKTYPLGDLIEKKKINLPTTSEVADDFNNVEQPQEDVTENPEREKKLKPLPKGQQTLNFPLMKAEPVTKAKIDNLVADD